MTEVKQTKEEETDPLNGNQDIRSAARGSDEISLVDILLILKRRKKIFLSIFVGCTLLGIVLASVLPAKYSFRSTFEIGYTLIDTGKEVRFSPVDTPDGVLAKIQESYLPLAESALLQEFGKASEIPEVSVDVPLHSQLVVLKSKGTVRDLNRIARLHKLALGPLIEDHKRIFAAAKSHYESALVREQLKLAELENPKVFAVRENNLKTNVQQANFDLHELKDQQKLLTDKSKHLDRTGELLGQQIKEVGSILSGATQNRQKALGEVQGEAKAMTLLMIDNQVEQNRNRLSSLQERYFVQLPEQKDNLQKALDDNKRQQEIQKAKVFDSKSQLEKLYIDHRQEQDVQRQKIAEIQSRIDQMQESKMLGIAVRSIKTLLSKKIMFLVGVFVGILFGFVGVFVFEVLYQVNGELSRQ